MKLTSEVRDITEVYDGSSEHGSSTIHVICPFCGKDNEVYVWSFSACGRKCQGGNCSAHLTRFHGARMTIDVTDSQYQIMKDLESFLISDRDCGWWPSKRSLNSLVRKGLIFYGANKNKTELGYMLTSTGKKCMQNSQENRDER